MCIYIYIYITDLPIVYNGYVFNIHLWEEDDKSKYDTKIRKIASGFTRIWIFIRILIANGRHKSRDGLPNRENNVYPQRGAMLSRWRVNTGRFPGQGCNASAAPPTNKLTLMNVSEDAR